MLRWMMIFLLICCIPAVPRTARSGSLVVTTDHAEEYLLGPHLEYYEDRSARLTIDDILSGTYDGQFLRSTKDTLDFGFSNSTFWFKSEILDMKQGDHRNEWFLELDYPLLDIIELYDMNSDGSYRFTKTGDMMPFRDRKIQNRNFVFKLYTERGKKKTVLIKVRSTSSTKIKCILRTPDGFIRNNQDVFFLYGIFYGVLLIMVFYNLFLFFSIQDKTYLLYVLYVACFILMRSSMDGFATQYLWPGNIWWSNISITFLSAVTTVIGALFIINFLNTKANLPLVHKVFLVFLLLCCTDAVLSLIIPYHISIQFVGLLMASGCLLSLFAGYLTFVKGYRPARYFIIAWSFFLVGNVIFSLNRFGLLPSSFVAERGMHLGSLLEVVLLSFALGDRINSIKKEKEEAQQLAIDNLHKADQLKDEFLANTSHELRTPLNGIIGLAESLIDGVAGALAPPAVKNLFMISSSGRRLANLVNDILDYSKLKHKEIELSKKPVDVSTLSDSVIELSRSLIGGRDIVLQNTVTPGALFVFADENRVQQILLNLVGNALKFTDSGSVVISAGRVGEEVEISVTDTGIGIPAPDLDRVFESFEQVDGSISRRYGGTGIGLSITKNLVELHGGTIRVESDPGKGSVFRFTLPASGNDRPDLTEIRAVSAGGPSGDTGYHEKVAGVPVNHGSPENRFYEILAGKNNYDRALVHIVDDDPVNLQVLENHLLVHNYDIVKSMDGIDALDKINKGAKPDLVLLDIMMPRMSGYEVLKILRGRYSLFDLPVMMLTAKNRIEDIVTAFVTGANDYLAKPFDKNELLARVKTLVTLKTAVKENRRLFSIDKELEVARRILQTAIPEDIPVLSNVDIAVKYIPAESVGGDYYDFHVVDNCIGILISDVSGHGISAALIASMVKIVFSILRPLARDPGALLHEMNSIMTGHMERNFLTAAYAYIDIGTGTLKYSRAGHEPLIIHKRRTGEYIKYLPPGRAIGLTAEGNYTVSAIDIEPGDRILLLTDGIIESMNRNSEMFGSRNFMDAVKSHHELSANELADYILELMYTWSGKSRNFEDDFSLVIVDVK